MIQWKYRSEYRLIRFWAVAAHALSRSVLCGKSFSDTQNQRLRCGFFKCTLFRNPISEGVILWLFFDLPTVVKQRRNTKFKEEETIVNTAQFQKQKCDPRYRRARSEGKQTGSKLLSLRGLKSSAGRTELMERSGISVVSYTLPQGKEADCSTREAIN